MENKIPRVGVGGPVGSGKTALIEAVVPVLVKNGYDPIILTNDIVTKGISVSSSRLWLRGTRLFLSSDKVQYLPVAARRGSEIFTPRCSSFPGFTSLQSELFIYLSINFFLVKFLSELL